MALGNTKVILEKSAYLQEGETEISERAFNLIIGGMLLWGFLLNYLTVTLFAEQAIRLVYNMNPFIFLAVYLVLVIVGNLMVTQGGAAMSFIGYTLIAAPIGIVLCVTLQGIPVDTVKSAVLVTAIVSLSFMIAGTLFPNFFLSLGRVLFFSLLFMIVGSLVSLLLFGRHGGMVYEWIGTAIFSLFIGYDWARANTCARTVNNAIDLSASLYLDIVNLFLRLLQMMSRNRK